MGLLIFNYLFDVVETNSKMKANFFVLLPKLSHLITATYLKLTYGSYWQSWKDMFENVFFEQSKVSHAVYLCALSFSLFLSI